jgi:hypothetical protein
MAVTGTVEAASEGLVGVNVDSVLTPIDASHLLANGFHFCVRHLSRAADQGISDLSRAEASMILNAGLGLIPVQHAPPPGWSPTSALGAVDGVYAADHSFVIGFPPGVNVWCDLERTRRLRSNYPCVLSSGRITFRAEPRRLPSHRRRRLRHESGIGYDSRTRRA